MAISKRSPLLKNTDNTDSVVGKLTDEINKQDLEEVNGGTFSWINPIITQILKCGFVRTISADCNGIRCDFWNKR